MRIARARPSPGTCSRCSTPRCPSSAWCSTRSPPRRSTTPSTTPASSTAAWSTPRRPAASSTASTATRSPRSCGRRSCRGLSAGRVQSRGHPRRRGAGAGAHGVPRRRLVGPAGHLPPRSRRPGPDAVPGDPGRARRQPAGHRQGLRLRRASSPARPDRRRGAAGRGRRPTRSATPWPTGPSRSARSSASRTPAARRRRSSPRRCSRRPAASCACPRRRPCRTAQRLYENGYITYMRTDSTTLSDTALDAARAPDPGEVRQGLPARRAPHLRQQGQERPGGPRGHPPRGRLVPHPRRGAASCGAAELRLYELIWQRTVASQMTDARGESVQVRLVATTDRPDGRPRPVFSASGRTIQFPGFLRAYVEGSDDPDAALDDQERVLPRHGRGRRHASPTQLERGRPRDPAAGPLHRGLAGQAARGARRRAGRPPTPRSSRPSRTAATCGRRARRWCRASRPSP